MASRTKIFLKTLFTTTTCVRSPIKNHPPRFDFYGENGLKDGIGRYPFEFGSGFGSGSGPRSYFSCSSPDKNGASRFDFYGEYGKKIDVGRYPFGFGSGFRSGLSCYSGTSSSFVKPANKSRGPRFNFHGGNGLKDGFGRYPFGFGSGYRPGFGSGSRYSTSASLACVDDYEEYRRNLYGGVTHKALLVDAVGTLVIPSQPMAQIYRQIGEKYGVDVSEDEILSRYRRAYGQPWGRSRLRYVNDGRPFWQHIVSASTGCSNTEYFEELYNYYTTEKAWHLCDPEAENVFKALKKAGVKLAVVSNFDTRLRPLLRALKCDGWFDAVAVSAEVAAEKPNPTIFLKACELLGVEPEDAVHVGDDRRNDIWGARDAGCDAWLWGSDVHSFKEVAERIGVKV